MPKMRSPLILILAVACGGMAFLISMNAIKPQPKTQQEGKVVGLVHDVEIGSMVKREDLDLFPVPQDANPKVLLKDYDAAVGRISRKNLLKGSILKSIDLLAEGENLASLIPEGYRAVTIPVTLSSKVTNFLEVGNRVDILLSYESQGGALESATLAKGVRVIGVSQDKANGDNKEMYITLAVTPEGAEALVYGMKKGIINVTVYPLSESEELPEEFYSIKDLFFKTPEKTEEPAGPSSGFLIPSKPGVNIEVIRGIQKEEVRLEETQ